MTAALGPDSLDRATRLFLLGVVLILATGLLPYISAAQPIPVSDPVGDGTSLDAIDSDGTAEEILGIDRIDWVVLAAFGVVTAFLVVTEPWSPIPLGMAGVSGVAAVALGGIYVVEPLWLYSDWVQSEAGSIVSPGLGAYIALAGGIVQLGSVYLGYSQSQSDDPVRKLDSQATPRDGPAPQQRQPPRQGPPAGRQPRGTQSQDQPTRRNQPPGQNRPSGQEPQPENSHDKQSEQTDAERSERE